MHKRLYMAISATQEEAGPATLKLKSRGSCWLLSSCFSICRKRRQTTTSSGDCCAILTICLNSGWSFHGKLSLCKYLKAVHIAQQGVTLMRKLLEIGDKSFLHLPGWSACEKVPARPPLAPFIEARPADPLEFLKLSIRSRESRSEATWFSSI